MAEIRMVAGLGNPGDEYTETRHNVGFKVVDLLAKTLDIDIRKKKFERVLARENFAIKS